VFKMFKLNFSSLFSACKISMCKSDLNLDSDI
jgi:hypothetical protein